MHPGWAASSGLREKKTGCGEVRQGALSLFLGSLPVEGVWSRDGTTVDQERQAYLLFSVAAAISLSRFAHVYCALSMRRKETLNTEESKSFY